MCFGDFYFYSRRFVANRREMEQSDVPLVEFLSLCCYVRVTSFDCWLTPLDVDREIERKTVVKKQKNKNADFFLACDLFYYYYYSVPSDRVHDFSSCFGSPLNVYFWVTASWAILFVCLPLLTFETSISSKRDEKSSKRNIF